jgi:hypothetical protein
MEFYSTMKKNEILSFTSKWVELENITLSDVSQAQKTKNLVLHQMRTLDLKQMQWYYWTWVTHWRENTYMRNRERLETQNLKVCDVPTVEKLI